MPRALRALRRRAHRHACLLPVHWEVSLGGTCSCGTVASGGAVSAGATTTGKSTVGRACRRAASTSTVSRWRERRCLAPSLQHGTIGINEPWGTGMLYGLTIGAASRGHQHGAHVEGHGRRAHLARALTPRRFGRCTALSWAPASSSAVGHQWPCHRRPPRQFSMRCHLLRLVLKLFYASKWPVRGSWMAAHPNGDWTSNNAAIKWILSRLRPEVLPPRWASLASAMAAGVTTLAALVRRHASALPRDQAVDCIVPRHLRRLCQRARITPIMAYIQVAHGTEVVATCPELCLSTRLQAAARCPAVRGGDARYPVRRMSDSEWYDYCFARCDAAGAGSRRSRHAASRQPHVRVQAGRLYRHGVPEHDDGGLYVPQYTSLFQRYSATQTAADCRWRREPRLSSDLVRRLRVDTTTKTCTFYGTGYLQDPGQPDRGGRRFWSAAGCGCSLAHARHDSRGDDSHATAATATPHC